ncbi:PAS domain-containing protein [Stigmatella aurantiaca]|uniref:histidine kinase n=3 Tax=Stigmatella aurantiaca TaxID=41 RepID=E3FQ87_STIAD|nr:PAS domain-containing protein [Stigmatella aurantiaca]ADO68197.1 Sensor protein [Stigmatella aurantiaca DW4/3-1]
MDSPSASHPLKDMVGCEFLLESLTDAVLVLDRDWRITTLNGAAEGIIGRSRELLVGQNLWTALPELAPTPLGAAFHAAHASGERSTHTGHYAPFGAWFEARIIPQDTGIVAFIRDVSPLHEAELERVRLVAAERAAYERAERAAHRLTRLQEFTARLSAARSPDEVTQQTVACTMAAVGATMAMVGVPTETLRTLRVAACQGLPPQLLRECQVLPLDSILPMSVAFRGEPEWIESPEEFSARYPQLAKTMGEDAAARSLASLPLVVEERVLGVLTLCYPEPRTFPAEEREFLLALARHSALALDRARLLAEGETQRARLEELVMCAPAVVSVTRGSGHRYVLCNPRYRQLLGGKDLTGMSAREAVPTLDGQGVFEAMDRVYETGEPFISKEFPVRLGPKSDVPSEAFFDFVHQPLRDSEGRVEGIATFAFDVTDQVLARRTVEELLRDMARSEERFRAFLTATSEIIWDMPPRGGFDSDQPGWRAFTGQTREELLGWGWLNAVHPEDRLGTELAWREAVKAGKLFQNEVRLRRHDGMYRHMHMRAVPVLELDGTVREWVGIHRDITRQREDEVERARLLSREQRHRAQLQGLAAASLAIGQAASLDAVLLVITEEARELIGAHQSVTSLTTGEDGAQSISAVSLSEKYSQYRGYSPRADGWGFSAQVCRTNQPLRMAQPELEAHPEWRSIGQSEAEHPPPRGWLAVPLVGSSGSNLGLIQLSDRHEGDFTAEDEAILVQLARMASVAIENARLMAESQAANRAKDEFLAVMSHELRTPLTAVLGWTQMLRTRRNDPAIQEKGLDVIERNARSLAQLIEDVLDVSRILTGKLALHQRAVDLASVVQAAVEVVRPRAEQKGVTLVMEAGVGGGMVTGDPGRLQQVFWNLLVNAVKFTPSGGRVEVRVERGNAEWRVWIKDSGQGIRVEALPHLFERFWQADGSSTREHGGLGLGLAIVRHLVELHGGEVEAESAGLGHGSTFTVRLPVPALLPEPERLASSAEGVAPQVRLDGVRVLLVEDAEDARELITLLLRDRGAQVRAVSNARDAMESLEEVLPDVVVSDIGLPGEDGHALLKRMRAWAEARDQWLPAIALTAYAGAEDARRAYRAGFQVHMAKPLESDALVESVARLAARDRDAGPHAG